MGYLQRAAGIPNFSKGVISIWFWIPAASIAAATAEYEAWAEGDGFDGNLIGVIPLMTFGPNTETAFFSGDMTSGDLSPCVIGVACDDTGAHMYARFQYDSGAQGYPIDYNDFFQVGSRVGASTSGGSGTPLNIEVTPDEWHHILISFDFSGGCATTYTGSGDNVGFDTTCPFYWALDDVNKDGNHLWPNTPSMFGLSAAQGIVSDLSIALQPAEPPENVFPPSYSFGAGNITTESNPFAIPTDSTRTTHIYNVVQADIQMFTDVTLNASVEDNRRVFVTEEGTPAAPTLAATLLGKSPEVLFIGDWLAGVNLGTAGSFSKTGTLTSFEPTP